ncbi:hypothetical protein SDC9_120683 [bioreactor metagenome]|uniref:Uncharacterized protein n=1 Tax=bioreactor metagenome TaxID=1076179 RepID=A0A645C9U3_9ZZZZ
MRRGAIRRQPVWRREDGGNADGGEIAGHVHRSSRLRPAGAVLLWQRRGGAGGVRAFKSAFRPAARGCPCSAPAFMPRGSGGGQARYGRHGRDPGKAGHGFYLRQRRLLRPDDGQYPLRRQQQLKAIHEREGKAVPVLLCLIPVPLAKGHHHRVLRHRVPELPKGL